MDSRKLWGLDIQVVQQTDSTNSVLMKTPLLAVGEALLALEQSRGRGRRGRVWETGPPGQLFGSFWVAPGQWPHYLPAFTLFLGLVLFYSLKSLGLKGHQLKWPNDVLFGEKKLAGILCESKQQGLVAGIGVNIKGDPSDFPKAVKQRVISLESLGVKPVPPLVLFELILDQAERLLAEHPDLASLIQSWEKHSGSLGRSVRVEQNGTLCNGVIKGLSPRGALLIELKGQTVEFSGGEVFFL